MKIVICGAGIAGLTLAWCLERQGHELLIVERARQLRDDGYMMDFFGSGYDVSERLRLLPDLETIHEPIERLVFVDSQGRPRVSLPYATVRANFFGGRHFNFLRGALERTLHDKLQGRKSICFGTTVHSFDQSEGAIYVRLTNGSVVKADLLIGADGMHSRIRQLAFGADGAFVRTLGYTGAAYIIAAPPAALRLERTVVILTVPGRQVTLYPIQGDRTATFFVYADHRFPARPGLDPCETLQRVYGDLGWIVPETLACCPAARDVYFDPIAQVEMPSWSRGRVALVGDACQCLSPLAGQGASMAMTGAYILADELARGGQDHQAAFAQYERRVRPSIEAQQRAARRMGRWFVPRHRFELAVRNALTRASTWPLISSMIRARLASQSLFQPSRASIL